MLFVSSERRHLLDTESWAVELFLELELDTGLQAKKRNQECRQVLGELSLTRIVEGGQGLGDMFVWGYLCRNTYDWNLMSWGEGAEHCGIFLCDAIHGCERGGHGS